MKLVNAIVLGMFFSLISLFVSCKEEESMIQGGSRPLEFSYSGIELTNNGRWKGDIPSEGISFSIIPDKKYADVAQYFVVRYDGRTVGFDRDYWGYDDYNYKQFEEGAEISGEWGSVCINFEVSPYSYDFEISKNDTGKDREIVIGIGMVDLRASSIYLTQKGTKE